MRGLLIAFEGLDQSGKQTQAELLRDHLKAAGQKVRLLSFPDVARGWIEKVFPFERQILAAARPLARTLLDIPLPDQTVFADVQRLSEKLIAMNAILRDREHCSIRLVISARMREGPARRQTTWSQTARSR